MKSPDSPGVTRSANDRHQDRGERRPQRLLIDANTRLSVGGMQLLNEIVPRLAAQQGPGQSVAVIIGEQNLQSFNAADVEIIRTNASKHSWLDRWRWYRTGLPDLASSRDATAVYSFSGFASKPLVNRIPTVITVNNMLPFSPELSLEFSGGRLRDRVRNRVLRWQYCSALGQADAVVLHSDYALQMMGSFVDGLSSKTTVALTGIPSGLVDGDAGAHPFNDTPYVLFLSVFRRYKNHLRLIEAYGEARQEMPDLPVLKLVGLPVDQAYVDEIQDAITTHGLSDYVELVGAVDRHAIPGLLHHAELHLLPSRCETNCVVAAEIMAVGGALACSDIPPLREVALNSAQYFDPTSTASIRDAIVELWSDPERIRIFRAASKARAGDLSWDTCATAIWDSVERATTGRARMETST